jgi:hypothetical protein
MIAVYDSARFAIHNVFSDCGVPVNIPLSALLETKTPPLLAQPVRQNKGRGTSR